MWRSPGVELFGDSTYTYKHTNPPLNTVDRVEASLQLYSPPPDNQNFAQLLPGSRTWAAEEGCYVVASPLDTQNPAKYPEYKGIIIRESSAIQEIWSEASGVPPSASWTTFSQGTVFATLPLGDVEVDGQWVAMPGVRTEPFNLCGAYFTGLHPETVLTVQLNVYWETFPCVYDELLTLATPSLGADDRLLMICSEIFNSLPVGVPASENPDGEWFARVVRELVPVARIAAASSGQAWALPLVEAASWAANSYLQPNGGMKVKQQPKQPPPKKGAAKKPAQKPKPKPKK